MPAGFSVFIDESGDEGFNFAPPGTPKKSSHWFVLAAVAVRCAREPEIIKGMADVRAILRKPALRALHFADMRHEQRVAYVKTLANLPCRGVAIIIHKPSLKKQDTFKARGRLYFYAGRYLLERVSWMCRDGHKREAAGDGSAKIIFSNKSGMSYDEFCDYVRRLKQNPDVRINDGAIDCDQIEAKPHYQMAGLQVADAFASSFYQAVEPSSYGFVESSYAQSLEQRMYHYNQKQCKNYGVKVFPGIMHLTKPPRFL